MAISRKVVRVVVKVSETFEEDLKTSLDTEFSGGDWSIVYMERLEHARDKVSFLIIAEQVV